MGRFVPNPKFAQEIGRSVQMVRFLHDIAEEVAETVRSIGPVGDSPAGARYVDQIEAVSGIDKGRAIGRVNAKKFTSHWIEFGTTRTRAHAPLRRAAEANGLRLRGGRG